MNVLFVVFIVLTVIVALLMIGIVLIQKSKGGGLSSQFGGGNQVLGVRGTNSFLEKATWTLAGLILVFSVCAAYTMPKAVTGTTVRTEAGAAKTATPGANNFGTQSDNAGKAATQTPEGN